MGQVRLTTSVDDDDNLHRRRGLFQSADSTAVRRLDRQIVGMTTLTAISGVIISSHGAAVIRVHDQHSEYQATYRKKLQIGH